MCNNKSSSSYLNLSSNILSNFFELSHVPFDQIILDQNLDFLIILNSSAEPTSQLPSPFSLLSLAS
jgi:hypothetical protein